jgi:hypothetical protein
MNSHDSSKKEFLKSQYWYLTIAASFSRANVYAPNTNDIQKVDFKKELFNFVDDLVSRNYSNTEVKEDNHIKFIEDIQTFSKKFNILNGGELKIGVCQKILNLYLKYLWCANYIIEKPPHFPLDRMIQEHALKKVLVNWTSLNDIDIYSEIINAIYKGLDKAEWELIEYNKIVNK